MKNLRLIVGSTLGGIVGSLAMYVFIAWASQTYVLPTSGTDHGTEHLTNIPNRDEALRSTFAGVSAPTSPTPVEGQLWWESDLDLLHVYAGGPGWYEAAVRQSGNTFVADQAISHAGSPKLTVTDDTNNVTTRILSTDTQGFGGTSTNHSYVVQTNANDRTTWDTSGNQTTAGGEIRTTNGADHTATAACASGYTRVGLWCYDTDGVLSAVRGTITTPDSGYVTTVVGSGYKVAIIQTSALVIQDGTGETFDLVTCTQPGDSANTTCSSSSRSGAVASAALASERTTAIAEVTVRLDSSGQVATKCSASAGTVTATQCTWFLVAYL